MFQYDRIDITEGIDINKTGASKECMICHYWYFKNISYIFEPHVCMIVMILMMACELKSIAMLNVIMDVFYEI